MSSELPLVYRQNPRPIGFGVSYRLAGNRLVIDSGARQSEIALGNVEQVRLTYEPRSMAQAAFQTALRLKDGRTIKLSSITWRGMFDVRRQDADYGAFVRALLSAVTEASPNARILAGKPQLQWFAMAVLAGISLVAAAAFVFQAVWAGATTAVLFGIGVAAVGIWQLEPMVRLNRPRTLAPGEWPRRLLP